MRERTTEEKLAIVISRLVGVEAAQKRWDERFAKLEWFESAPTNAHQSTPGRVSWTIRGQA